MCVCVCVCVCVCEIKNPQGRGAGPPPLRVDPAPHVGHVTYSHAHTLDGHKGSHEVHVATQGMCVFEGINFTVVIVFYR